MQTPLGPGYIYVPYAPYICTTYVPYVPYPQLPLEDDIVQDHVMLAKWLRTRGIRTSFNLIGEFGVLKPLRHNDFGETEMITFKLNKHVLECSRGWSYDLSRPRPMKYLERSIKACMQSCGCYMNCLFE